MVADEGAPYVSQFRDEPLYEIPVPPKPPAYAAPIAAEVPEEPADHHELEQKLSEPSPFDAVLASQYAQPMAVEPLFESAPEPEDTEPASSDIAASPIMPDRQPEPQRPAPARPARNDAKKNFGDEQRARNQRPQTAQRTQRSAERLGGSGITHPGPTHLGRRRHGGIAGDAQEIADLAQQRVGLLDQAMIVDDVKTWVGRRGLL